jgi:hypothetical protein
MWTEGETSVVKLIWEFLQLSVVNAMKNVPMKITTLIPFYGKHKNTCFSTTTCKYGVQCQLEA